MGAGLQTIRVEREPSWAAVVLSRPEARNALNAALIAELTSALRELARDSSLRAVVLSGDGPAFCAGADAGWMKQAGSLSAAENEADAGRLSALFEAWRDLPCPTLCLAHGAALGGGVGLVAAADIAIAEAGCRFGFTEVRLGLIPAVISQVVVPAIGAHRAARYFLTGEVFGAERAAELGLVSEVAPAGEGRSRLDRVRADVVAAAPQAVREAKALLRRYRPGAGAHPAPEELARTIARIRGGAEAKEGLTAFLEKRDPAWKGGS